MTEVSNKKKNNTFICKISKAAINIARVREKNHKGNFTTVINLK
jgi:hypothetical protein